jgi:uncharacterized protein
MIKPSEIQLKAREAGVRDQQIEKDYILSWLLSGIAKHEQLSKVLIFKGGTVLKKVYFEDYRFSEDLDFTLLVDEVSNEQIFEWFKESFLYILESANIQHEIIDNNVHEDSGINFYISYTGPLGVLGHNKKVKVDISRSEQLAFEPILKTIFLSYSDLLPHPFLCYTLEEILVEKMRTIMQRMQARDFYDIWYLLEMHQMDITFYTKEFREKCVNKKLNPADFHKKLGERLPQYKGRWQSSMQEQIKNLPDFDQVEREVMRHLKHLEF